MDGFDTDFMATTTTTVSHRVILHVCLIQLRPSTSIRKASRSTINCSITSIEAVQRH